MDESEIGTHRWLHDLDLSDPDKYVVGRDPIADDRAAMAIRAPTEDEVCDNAHLLLPRANQADPHEGKVYDIWSDEWYSPEEVPVYRNCLLCGEGGWPEGVECRQVKKARAEGRL